MTTEREIKLLAAEGLDALHLRAVVLELGFEIEASDVKSHEDTYLDTADGHLGASGLALRQRRCGDQSTLTIKGKAQVDGAFLNRLELECQQDRAELPATAADVPDPLCAHVEAVSYDRPLTTLLALNIERHSLHVVLDQTRAEICLDRVQTADGSSFTEVELEWIEGDPEVLSDLAAVLKERLHLSASTEDKLRRGLALVGASRKEGIEEVKLSGKMPARTAAFLVFRRFFLGIQHHEPGTRLRSEVEDLHQIRVHVRRLRAAMRTFAAVFPDQELRPWQKLLQSTGQALGPARDLDVMIENLDVLRSQVPENLQNGLDDLATALLGERDQEQRRVLRHLRSSARLKAFARFEDFLARGPRHTQHSLQLRQVAPGLVLQAARRVLTRGRKLRPDTAAERYHELRIDCKRLRYMLDVFRPVAGKGLGKVVRRLARLQGVLGENNDAHVAVEWLEAWTRKKARKFSQPTLLAAGAMIGACAGAGQVALLQFPEVWQQFNSAKTRKRLLEVWFEKW